MTDTIRKLARIVKLDDVCKHYNADALDIATVGGWKVVAKRDEFKTGDLAIYIEVDAWVPSTVAPFLTKPGHFPKTYNEVAGERLKTVRLRGQVSQGLILPVGAIDAMGPEHDVGFHIEVRIEEGFDLTEALGIQKWEAPVSANLAGNAKGNFPSFISKTDQERCLPNDALISTKFGKIQIDRIKVGDSVNSYDHDTNSIRENMVTDVIISSEVDEWFELTTASGKILTVTHNHKVFLPNLGCYRNAEELQVGDVLLEEYLIFGIRMQERKKLLRITDIS
jgi:hypothetical protein